MSGCALSEHVKQQAQRRHKNARYQKAIDKYMIEQNHTLAPGERRRGFWPIAKEWKVKKSTLQRLVNGGESLSAFNASKRKLTYVEEHVFILESSD